MQPIQKKSDAGLREVRLKQVAANLLAGLSYRQIAEGLNVSVGTVASDVKRLLDRWKKEQVTIVDDVVRVEVQRLDRAMAAIWTKVQGGDLEAIDRMVKLMERRAKLLGLDAPKRVEEDLTLHTSHEEALQQLE